MINAIKAQNAQVAAGQLGGTPPVKGQQLNASIIAQTRLTSTDEFGKNPAEGEPGWLPGSSA
ncbi:acriflavin resistance protein B [Salmonella enterica subsp. arizonae]|uniref:Acriflavin resistance protein B n=1 Tax=Salmonella enterica subsp. arizonae TaxID=59203 RepID=A0A379TFX9_SALER|nr:acriflavin resistance protein B [Salmonella enterica subsp. arizonae]